MHELVQVNAGEGAGERDWSGKATAAIVDDEEEDESLDAVAGAETKHGRGAGMHADAGVGKATAVVADDEEEL